MNKLSPFAMLSTAEKSLSKRESGASASGSKKMKTNKGDSPNYDIPDRQFADLYCPICDSHMNSEGMWESHIQGKRHLKNKIKGKPENDDIIEIGSESKTCDKLDDVKEIIVGLNNVCELVRDDQDPVYHCFLCSANVPNVSQLINHLITTKHRVAFLKEKDPKGYESIKKLDLRKGQIEPVVEDLCADYERQHGRGKIHIKKETPKPEDDWARRNKFKQKPTSEKPRNQDIRDRLRSFAGDYEDPYKQSYERYDDSYRSSVVTYEYSHSKPTEYPPLKESDIKEDNRSFAQGSRYQDSYNDEYFGKASPSSLKRDLDYREKDLRSLLDNKKSRFDQIQATPSISPPNDYFSIIDKMPIDLFLKMADFKLGSCSFDLPSELALLKKIVEKGQKIIQEKQNNLLSAASKGNSSVWPNILNQNVVPAPTYTHSEIPGLSVGHNQPIMTPTSVDLQKTENFLKTLKLLMHQQ